MFTPMITAPPVNVYIQDFMALAQKPLNLPSSMFFMPSTEILNNLSNLNLKLYQPVTDLVTRTLNETVTVTRTLKEIVTFTSIETYGSWATQTITSGAESLNASSIGACTCYGWLTVSTGGCLVQ